MEMLPPAVGALGLAAVFSAEISAADAVLFMLATSLSQDLYKRYLRPEASEARVLRVARAATILASAVSVMLAVVLGSVVNALTIFYTLLTVSFFVPVLAGLYLPSASASEALASIGCGVGAVFVLQLSGGGAPVAGFTPALGGLIAAAMGFVAVHMVGSRRYVSPSL